MAGNLKRVKKNRLLALCQRSTMYNEIIISILGEYERFTNEHMMRDNPGLRHFNTGATMMVFNNRYWMDDGQRQFRLSARAYIPKSYWFNTEPIEGRRGVRRITFVDEDSDI